MNIYLDIDGVLLVDVGKPAHLANEENLAIGAAEFIKYAVEHFDVYWLTTHCVDGNPDRAVDYVQRAADEDLLPWLAKIQPTKWGLKKTEAIDFGQPFLWFDDNCLSGERYDLQQHQALDSWIEIDLRKSPNQMARELVTLQAFAK